MSVYRDDDFERDLPISSSLRLYPVMIDTEFRERFLNVFRSYSVDDDVYNNESLFDYYTLQDDEWLENISAKFYRTPYLWWVIALFNGIDNPFEELEEGKVIRVLKYSNIYTIFDDITSIESL